MTSQTSTTGFVSVAIDVAKGMHHVLVELPDGRRRALRIANSASEIERLLPLRWSRRS